MVLEAAQVVERTPLCWRQIGQALSRIHRIKGERYGFEKQGYFGPVPGQPAPARLADFLR